MFAKIGKWIIKVCKTIIYFFKEKKELKKKIKQSKKNN